MSGAPEQNLARPTLVKRRIGWSRLIIWPLGAGLFVTGSHWSPGAATGLMLLFGCALAAAATIGRLWCSLYICGYKTQRLVTSGPYSMSRNPLYFFSSLGAVGVGLATQTLSIPLVLAVLFAVYYPIVIRFEEKKLEGLHGDPYRAYLAAVPRFFPRWSQLSEPAEYTVEPNKFRRALRDAPWFLVAVGALQLAAALRASGLVPTLLRLY